MAIWPDSPANGGDLCYDYLKRPVRRVHRDVRHAAVWLGVQDVDVAQVGSVLVHRPATHRVHDL
jgi:hypothetical protein